MQNDDFSFELNSNAKMSNGRFWVGGQVYGSGGQEGTWAGVTNLVDVRAEKLWKWLRLFKKKMLA